MGRRKKYFSDEEKKVANNEKVKQFYWKNKDRLDKKSRAYYWVKKIKILLDEGKSDEAEKIRNAAILKGIDPEFLEV